MIEYGYRSQERKADSRSPIFMIWREPEGDEENEDEKKNLFVFSSSIDGNRHDCMRC